MKAATKAIATKIALICGVLAIAVATFAMSSHPPAFTFATGGLQLQIDSRTVYNGVLQPALSWSLKNLVPGVDKFFNFNDIKPGDSGETTISLHTDQNAWACLDFTNLKDLDNGNNEPEAIEDPNGALGGELSKGVEFFGWLDDGDNTFEVGEKPIFGTSTPQAGFDVLKKYILTDSSTGSFFPANVTKYVGISWCAGNLVVNTADATITCDGSVLGNIAQSDSFSVDVGLRVVAASDNPTFRCDGTIPPPLPMVGLKLIMEKKFSGPAWGFTPEQFSFHIVGNGIDAIVPHEGSINLPIGTYSITEVIPNGFEIPDWRIQWSGDTCDGENTAGGLGSITVKQKDLKKIVSYCRADNQYRPKDKNKIPNSGATGTSAVQSQSAGTGTGIAPRVERVVETVRKILRR